MKVCSRRDSFERLARSLARCAASAALLVACATEETVVELGRVEHYNDPAMIEAPTDARVGAPITVTVMTYGGGCVSFERTDIDESLNHVVVRPFDRRYVPSANEACTDDLRLITHTATLTFATAGSKRVLIQGRRVTFDVDEMIEVPVSISVQ